MEPITEHKPNPFIVPFSIIIAGALIGMGIYFSGTEKYRIANKIEQTKTLDSIDVNPVDGDDHILGNPNAEIVIIEFSDTECPYCKQFHKTMQRIMDEYGKDGKVAWVYRHMPIEKLHKRAKKEAEATECAAELGGNDKFWEYLDEIYKRTGSNDTLDPKELPKIAKDINLDEEKFDECLSSGRMVERVAEDFIDATNAGGRGTPYSILVGSKGDKVAINGALPYDVIKSAIDTALQQQ